jgi:hypothetical protein
MSSSNMIGLVFQRSYVRFPPWRGILFKLARSGYTLRVISQTSYSPEYTTPTQKKSWIPGLKYTFIELSTRYFEPSSEYWD